MSQKQQTMKTIIAEKPSVAKEIAHIVGADKREEGYMQGNGYYVTWVFGHLVQPAMPETYGMKGFHAENLPVIPDPFILVPRQVKTENGYKPDAGVLAQIKIIGKLFDSSERIIVATDAGLSGKSFIPMLIGTGCGIPGIMASRTIENERDRRMTIMTTTFIPCGAKVPFIAMIAGALFGGSAWVSTSAYFKIGRASCRERV